MTIRALFIVQLWLWCIVAQAHKPSDSYLNLRSDGGLVQGQWDIALRDLEDAIGLDVNDDGSITWGELRARQTEVYAYALSRLRISADRQECHPEAEGLLVTEHTDGRYAVLRFSANCAHEPQKLAIAYQLLFDLDRQHRGLLKLERAGMTDTAILSPESFGFESSRDMPNAPWRAFLEYVREGILHIWTGYDHILFLLSLLLPAALVAIDGRWQVVAGFRRAAWDVTKIVTAFTLAHSITLSISFLGYLTLPTRWIESAIAASVAAAALNNIGAWVLARRSWLAFGFGLVHGLGFASVLMDLGLPGNLRLIGLLGFNLGVEAGQLAIVALVLPVIVGLSRSRFYSPVVMKLGSACIAAVAFLWLAERSVGFSLPNF